MARGIVSCTGEEFNVGDKVRTEYGTIIVVEGAAIAKAFYNAEKCTKVASHTPTTRELEVKFVAAANTRLTPGEAPVKPVAGGANDCVIWGT